VKGLRWEFEEGESPLSHTSISADGKWLACPGSLVRLWDVTAGKQVWTSKGAGQGFVVLGFTPDNRLVLRGSKDSAVVVVDAARAKVVRTIATGAFDRVRRGLLSPDGTTLLLGLAAPWEIGAWDLNTGKPLPPLEDRGRPLGGFEFSPDGKTLVCVTKADTLRVVVRDWPSRKVRRQFDLGVPGFAAMSVSADNRTLSVLFHREQTLRRYDLGSGKPLPVPAETHRGQVLGVEVAPDGSILSLGTDKILRTWDLASGRQTRQVRLGFAPAGSPFSLSRDGKWVAAADVSRSEVVIVDRDGKVVRRIETAGQGIDHVVFSPSARFLAGSGWEAKVARVWETATGKTVAQFAAGKADWWSATVNVAFSPDERYFVATAEDKVQFWQVNGWRRAEGLSESAGGLAFSPDGRMLACGRGVGETAFWEVATRQLRFKLPPPAGSNHWPRFSPDGRLLARLRGPETVEVWDVFGGRKVASFQGHDSPIRAFAFTGDGRHLITASEDCTLLAWDLAGAVAARAGQKPPPR
jgi:WD40 repeat protein